MNILFSFKYLPSQGMLYVFVHTLALSSTGGEGEERGIK